MSSFQYPTVTVDTVPSLIAGNRLEPRPRSAEFNRSLRAEVRDASWLLARQWQMKEFRAEDRGSPIGARVELEHGLLNQVRLGGLNTADVTAYERAALPLDAVVQAQPPVVDLGLQLQMGRHWKRLLQTAGPLLAARVPALLATYRTAFPVPALGNSPFLVSRALAQSLPEATAVQIAVAERAIAGHDLYQWLALHPRVADFIQLSNAGDFSALEQKTLTEVAEKFTAWYRRTYTIAPGSSPTGAWSVPELAYQFSAAAPSSTTPVIVRATEHHGGELNWYTVDEEPPGGGAVFPNAAGLTASRAAFSFVPTEIQFAGAPNARWWEFEDRKVDFGQVTGDSSDMGRMLLQEFMFLYHNDWFSLPYSVPAGSICTLTQLVVTDVFGARYQIQPAGRNLKPEPDSPPAPLEEDWGRWSLFALSKGGNRDSSVPRLLLPPTAVKTQVGPLVEQVYLAREEATNLVWGVEKIVPNGLGRGTDGDSAAARVSEYLRGQASPSLPLASGAELEYKLATAVAENWIPFVPRPSSASNGIHQLEQGEMLRQVNNLELAGPDATVRPRTALLGVPGDAPYVVHEREVPPTGMRLEGSFRRTRWFNGGTVLWYGRNRNVGRSGGGSGLAYDQLLPRTGQNADGTADSPIGVVSVSRGVGNTLDSVQGFRLNEQGQPDGNLLEFSTAQLVDMLLANQPFVTMYQSAASTPWVILEPLVLAPTAGGYDVQLASGGALPAGPVYDPLVASHLQRVAAAGGQHVDQAFLIALVAHLRQLGVAEKILHLSDVRLGCVVNATGGVSRLFCLGGHDAVSRANVALPQRVAAGLNGRPTLQFQQAGLFVEDFSLASSNTYTLVALVRQGDGTGAVVGCRPSGEEDVRILSQYGFFRYRHVINYTGQELTLNEGNIGYNGGWITLGARYNLARTATQLVGSAYSFRTRQVHTMGYTYNNARNRRLLAAPLCLGSTGGPSPVYTADGGLVSLCWLRDYDDEAGLVSLRAFLQAAYIA